MYELFIPHKDTHRQFISRNLQFSQNHFVRLSLQFLVFPFFHAFPIPRPLNDLASMELSMDKTALSPLDSTRLDVEPAGIAKRRSAQRSVSWEKAAEKREKCKKKTEKGNGTRPVCGTRFFPIPYRSALFGRSNPALDRDDRLFPPREHLDRRSPVFIGRPTCELHACFRDTISSRNSLQLRAERLWLAALPWSYCFRYATRSHLCSYLRHGAVTAPMGGIINIRGMSIGTGVFAKRL